MFDSYLQDFSFLQEVNRYRVTEFFARIAILDFETEHLITTLEGKITAGNMNITVGSTRRSGSLTVVFDKLTFDLQNPDNLIAINKKVRITVGINNPFHGRGSWGHTIDGQFEEYPPTLLFPQGLFLITAANSSVSATSATVNMNFIDKMGMLNGTCGGTIPAGISLHDRLTFDGDGNTTVDYPRIRQIIREVVHHFGEEHYSKIIINDLPDFGRRVVRYGGSIPIRFTAGFNGSFVISDRIVPGFPNVFFQGDDIGYMASELRFPGELVKGAGVTVTAILDAIVDALGNYEYFYDVDGFFIFQRIRHFEMTGEAPLNPIAGLNSPYNISPELDGTFQTALLPQFNDVQFLNEFAGTDLVSSVNHNPQYAMIKNDFVVWGSRQREGEDSIVRMRLSIDTKPRETPDALCWRWIWEVRNADNTINRYLSLNSADNPTSAPGGPWTFTTANDLIGRNADGMTIRLHSPSLQHGTGGLDRNRHAGIRTWPGTPPANFNMPFEWREELYRMALMAFGSASGGTYYDMDLMAEWRAIYDPNSEPYAIRWREHFGETVNDPRWTGYRREIITDPSSIRYWIDIIDSNSPLGQYSVSRIGRRSVVEDNSQIHDVLNRQTPAIVFIDGSMPQEDIRQAVIEQTQVGANFHIIQKDILPLFTFRNSFGSCYEVIRDLLHRHLIYNASVTVQSQPIFYLDVNRVVRLNFPEQGIVGNYIINRLSWNIGGNPSMSLTANEAVVIV